MTSFPLNADDCHSIDSVAAVTCNIPPIMFQHPFPSTRSIIESVGGRVGCFCVRIAKLRPNIFSFNDCPSLNQCNLMKRKLTGCLIFAALMFLTIFVGCGFDYSTYQADISYNGPSVGVEFSSEWGTRVPFTAGMTSKGAVTQAVESQIRAGSTAVEPLERMSKAIDSARLLRRHSWSWRRAMPRILILPIVFDTAPLFDDEVLNGSKRSWRLQPGDYVTFEPRTGSH